jgi:acetyltransferase-like isoleucine patch superfamily enzyme
MADPRQRHPDRMPVKPPPNMRMGKDSVITGDIWTREAVFRRFKSVRDPALVIGERCQLDGPLFNMASDALVTIGDACHFDEVFLICEQEIRIGNRVVIGWHTTIADSDFHPLAPVERRADVIAISPLGDRAKRAAPPSAPVVIDDDVWIGANVTILKGVHVGAGALIEPGAVVVRDVPSRARVLGNPAQVIGEV